VEIDERGWDGQKATIEAIQHTTMTGQYVATILDAQLTLYLALHQITPCAKDGYHKTETHPLKEGERGFKARDNGSYTYCQQRTTDASYP
jgi:hypothetical protein